MPQGRAAAGAAFSPQCPIICIHTSSARIEMDSQKGKKKRALFLLFSGKTLTSFYWLARRNGLLGAEESFCSRPGKCVNSSSHPSWHISFWHLRISSLVAEKSRQEESRSWWAAEPSPAFSLNINNAGDLGGFGIRFRCVSTCPGQT